MKGWRPHIDLASLSAALSEEILAATDEDVRAASAVSGHAVAGAAHEVRELIEALSGEQSGPKNLLVADCVYFRASCARQH
jgi:hypothetical protein